MDTRSFLLPTQVDHGEHACAVAAEGARGCKGVSIPTAVPVGWGPGTGESHPRRQTGITHATAAHRRLRCETTETAVCGGGDDVCAVVRCRRVICAAWGWAGWAGARATISGVSGDRILGDFRCPAGLAGPQARKHAFMKAGVKADVACGSKV